MAPECFVSDQDKHFKYSIRFFSLEKLNFKCVLDMENILKDFNSLKYLL